jgi:hypothetical protein
MDEGPELGAMLAESARGQLLRRWDNAQPAREWARARVMLVGRGVPNGAPPGTPERGQ